jgi:hypothetical protein
MKAYTLTLTPADTTVRLATLIAAIETNAPTNYAQIDIEADSGNANPVLIGDAALDGTRYGRRLAASGTYNMTSGAGGNRLDTTSVYVRGVTTNNLKIHVILIPS